MRRVSNQKMAQTKPPFGIDAEKFDQVEFDEMITEEFNVEDQNAMN
jgi:hypothetical protein